MGPFSSVKREALSRLKSDPKVEDSLEYQLGYMIGNQDGEDRANAKWIRFVKKLVGMADAKRD